MLLQPNLLGIKDGRSGFYGRQTVSANDFYYLGDDCVTLHPVCGFFLATGDISALV